MVDQDEILVTMRTCLQDALDELLSPRVPIDAKTNALESLERQLALACFGNDPKNLNYFNSLQHTFECNVPSRLLSWISITTPKLDAITNKGAVDKLHESEASKLTSQLSLALSVIQGIALVHQASKVFLGRKPSLEVLLDLLLVSRHVATNSKENRTSQPHLSSIVLDTLICILVDSPNSLRFFESVNGVQVVVKILKRAGTPREVRMKCLEFLYFYLLDETPPPSKLREDQTKLCQPTLTPPGTAPTTPIRVAKKPYLSPVPLLPSSRQNSSSHLFPTPTSSIASRTLTPSSRSASNDSLMSMSSAASTAPSSIASSPDNTSIFSTDMPMAGSTPASSPFSHHAGALASPQSQPRVRAGHHKEVDYTPQSPLKPRHAGVRLARGNGSRHAPSKSLPVIPSIKIIPSVTKPSRAGVNKSWSDELVLSPSSSPTAARGREGSLRGLARMRAMSDGSEKTKTTEEKKELLGTMLGNVDALVESVRKAGIWGLG
ncbi:hypothetical protein AX17_002080 [Amanita inopinata Kibby_2008]|nr:hypothetical protein AX17_002080 [Amanita inopinata Kibby_2008]